MLASTNALTSHIHNQRRKFGGNKKTKYVEGWVEFEDKKLARQLAAALNGTQVGGKKGNFWYDDLWNMLYLPRFKWHHLTERYGDAHWPHKFTVLSS